MSRSGFSDYVPDDNASMLALWRWTINAERSIKGARGQSFLRDIVAALEAMPVKELESDTFEDGDSGCTCVLGEVAKSRGLEIDNSVIESCGECEKYDPTCPQCECEGGAADGHYLASMLGISRTMALEIVNENDSSGARYGVKRDVSPDVAARGDREARHAWMLRWARSRITAQGRQSHNPKP